MIYVRANTRVVYGGPHQPIRPGGEWSPRFKIDQPAATLWYHPHGLGTTAIQVYRGLAGLIILDDKNSDALSLPDEYDINDIPLIIQDRRFTEDGVPLYLTSIRDIMEGMKGNIVLVNGAVAPALEVKRTLYRFRLLNGSNARVYDFAFSSGSSFHQIATDAGLLEKPVQLTTLVLSPGERAEILVDFSAYRKGEKVYLTGAGFNILMFRVGDLSDTSLKIPEKLAVINEIPAASTQQSRLFSLEGMGRMVAINRKQMDMDRVDEYMKKGTAETWTITSSTRGMMGMGRGMMGRMGGSDIVHNFHAHGVPPAENERGWKDTVLVGEGEEVRVITRFLYRGLFMYHCHILEHEDNGMMGQFRVD